MTSMGVWTNSTSGVITEDRNEGIVQIGNPDGNSINAMWGANGGYLAVAIINWVLMFGKYFYYVYFGIGWDKIMALVNAVVGADLTGLGDALTAMLTRLTWPTPAGLLLGTILNTFVTTYVMSRYRASEDLMYPNLGAYVRQCDSFFWVWIFLGIGKPVLMSLDWVFGTKAFSLADPYTHMALIEIGEWFLTFLVLVISRGPLIAFYNRAQIHFSRDIIAKLPDVKKYADRFAVKHPELSFNYKVEAAAKASNNRSEPFVPKEDR